VRAISTGAGRPVTFHFGSGATVKCRVAFTDVVTNPLDESAPGIDETTAFQVSKCKASGGGSVCPRKGFGVSPLGLPWRSHRSEAVPAGAGSNDLIEGVELNVSCVGSKGPGTFKGKLSQLGKGRCSFACSLREWGAQSSLSGESGTLTLTGLDRIEGRRPNNERVLIGVCDCNQRS
jgi:hypothetical protein